MAQDHPENLKDINAIKITDIVRDRVKDLTGEVDDARNNRGVWEQRQEDYYRKRFGLRKRRNFPWPGYPNYVLPLIDSDIAQAKPSYCQRGIWCSPGRNV